MGAPMARNLVAAGHAVTGFDVAGVRVEGVAAAASAAAAARGRDAVITMLPDGAILRAVYAEIVPAGARGAVFIDCSTVDVDSARAVAALAEAAGLLAVDAPVSGGTGGAAAGTLTFMAGGSADGLRHGQAALRGHGAARGALRRRRRRAGGEDLQQHDPRHLDDRGLRGLRAGRRSSGLDAQALFDVVSTSSGSCWSVNTYCPVPGVGPTSPADNDYRPGFAAELMLKDLTLSQQAAEAVDAATPLGAHAAALYADFVAAGGRGRDFSAMLPRLAALGHGD